MATRSGTTSCAVAIARRGGGLSARSDVVTHIGEELFLDEQLRGLSGGSVTTGDGVVCTILLTLGGEVLHVENGRGRPTMFPLGCMNVDHNFHDIVRGGKVLTSLVEVASRIALRRADGSTGLKVVGRIFILAHCVLKM